MSAAPRSLVVALLSIALAAGPSVRALAQAGPAAASGTQPATTASPHREAAREQARTHFDHGLSLVREAAYAEAAVEFERAYALDPRYEVLYSLGLAYVMQRKPVQAAGALARYLELGGERIAPARRAEAHAELERQRARIAHLELQVQPAGARVRVDGVLLQAAAPLTHALELGEHTLVLELDGYRRHEARVSLAAGETLRFAVVLEKLPSPAASAQLGVRCPIPDVAIEVDGATLAQTPLAAPLLLPPGVHRLTLSRPGYVTQVRTLQLSPGQAASLACALPLSTSQDARRARLAVEVSEPRAEVRVDDAAVPAAGSLPSGRHLLRVEHPGFLPYEGEISLQANEERRIRVALVPTAAHLEAYSSKAHAVRTWAYVAGLGGLALGGAALGVALWNDGRFDDYTADREELVALSTSGRPLPDDYDARLTDNGEQLAGIQSTDKVVLGLGIAAGSALLTGVLLFLLGDDPYRYDDLPARSIVLP